MATQSGIDGIMQMLGFPGTVNGGLDPQTFGSGYGNRLAPSFDQFVRQFGLDPATLDEGTKAQLMQMFLQNQAQSMQQRQQPPQHTMVGNAGRRW